MLTELLATIWRRTPVRLRRWITQLTQTRFAVTVAGIITNPDGRVLLLRHTFRPGSGWGLPGGFLDAGEQPEAALRRELFEEVGLQLDDVELFMIRTFKRVNQIEILFRCTAVGTAKPQSAEISQLDWFSSSNLPEGLPGGQRDLIRKTLSED